MQLKINVSSYSATRVVHLYLQNQPSRPWDRVGYPLMLIHVQPCLSWACRGVAKVARACGDDCFANPAAFVPRICLQDPPSLYLLLSIYFAWRLMRGALVEVEMEEEKRGSHCTADYRQGVFTDCRGNVFSFGRQEWYVPLSCQQLKNFIYQGEPDIGDCRIVCE